MVLSTLAGFGCCYFAAVQHGFCIFITCQLAGLHDCLCFSCLFANNNNGATVFIVNATKLCLLRSNSVFLVLVTASAHCDILFFESHSRASLEFLLDVFISVSYSFILHFLVYYFRLL